jgi:hypothetical protein
MTTLLPQQTNILWTGREYYSLENCLVTINPSGAEIASTIVGKYHDVLYRLEYSIRTSREWETTSFNIMCQYNNKIERLTYESDGKGNWRTNDESADEFRDCIDIDIPLTPFTNTLPINRLQLKQGSEQEIKVIYLDFLGDGIRSVRQKYRKVSKTEYHYENILNDFEATIVVDDLGLVVDYPELFERTALLKSHYQKL